MSGVSGGRNIAEYDWCGAVMRDCTGHCESKRHNHRCDCIDPLLHAPSPDVKAAFDDWDGDPVEGSTACGVGVRLLILGPFSRMGGIRCEACCQQTGLPPGVGSPKNDDACRRVLGMPPAASHVIAETADHFGVSEELLLARQRKQPVTLYRQIAMYLCCLHSRYSLQHLAVLFGRDHSTIIHARKQIQNLLRSPTAEVTAHVAAIEAALGVGR